MEVKGYHFSSQFRRIEVRVADIQIDVRPEARPVDTPDRRFSRILGVALASIAAYYTLTVGWEGGLLIYGGGGYLVSDPSIDNAPHEVRRQRMHSYYLGSYPIYYLAVGIFCVTWIYFDIKTQLKLFPELPG